ncbi:potassium large conductance calcium-activated channel subfamily M alpha member 1 [Schistosoma bovis]|uniref:BK channel n=2 Tax=Schistosoma bovis TaxID=6184 RepID=A0A430QEJ1_SCHBO|nr:potassium large conductance calcium-activated channel subfamily M alpha member 1 [Schistosoma bovis]
MSINKKQIAHLNDDHQHLEKCMEKRLWGVFFLISVGCFFGGIFIIITYRIIMHIIMYLKSKQSIHSTSQHTNLSHRNKDGNEFHLLQKDTKTETNDDGNWIGSTGSEIYKKHNSKKCCFQCWTSIQQIFIEGRSWAIRLVSYDWMPGRIFIALSMIFSLTSFGIYAYEATMWPSEIEKCGHKGRRFRLLDFTMNIFFLLHFIVRLIASSDVLLFWIEWYSILDYLTVPPTIIGFFIKRTWIGFRFVRIFRLCNLPEVLNNLNVIKSASSLRMCQLCTLFISIWFAGAGCFSLFENTGNFFGSNTYNVSQHLPYTASLYYIIVTMSTVGYGDIVPQTYMGRVFISLFILFALATFASAIPEIVDMFFNVSKYSGVYQKPEGKSHIVVCGDITTDSVRTFLNDFLHEDRQRSDVEVGTVMDHNDLQRVKMESADACLILASATTKDPYQTDAANIMRVIAVKNFASHIRIIVQLLQTENKAYLLNSPYWNWECGDEIICFSELKLGFLAQSCIAPGFSTLVTNLFTMHSIKGLKEAAKFTKNYMNSYHHSKSIHHFNSNPYCKVVLNQSQTSSTPLSFNKERRKTKWFIQLPNIIKSLFKPNQNEQFKRIHNTIPSIQHSMDPITSTILDPESSLLLLDSNNWVHNYLHGASMEIYSAKFSITFNGLQFTEAAIICRKYLDLLLIAVVAKMNKTTDRQSLNKISKNSLNNNNNHSNIDNNNSHDDNDDDDDDDDDVDDDDDDDDENVNNTKYYLAVSPTLDQNVIINQGTIGFFICDSQENANKVSHYCTTCHMDNLSPSNIKSCTCQQKLHKSNSHLKLSRLCKSKKDPYSIPNQQITNNLKASLIIPELREESETIPNVSSSSLLLHNKQISQTDKDMAVITDKDLNESHTKSKTLSSRNSLHSAYDTEEHYSDVNENRPRRSSDTEVHLKTHTDQFNYEFDITGMYYYCDRQGFEDNLITTNSSHKQSHDLYNHILVCILAEPDAPLLGLHSFVMPLRASNFHPNQLRTILFLGDIKFLQREWSNIANFPKVYTLAGSALSRADLRAARIQYSSVCVILGSRGTVKVDDPYMLDKEVILCTLNIRAMQFSPYHRHKTFVHNVHKRRSGSEIPLITELMTDNNIHYLDPDHSGGLQIAASLTAPFAKGIAFTNSVLDVLASTAYFDRNSMTLIRHLVTGGVTPALEQWLAEGGGLIGHGDRYNKGKALSTKSIQTTRKDWCLFPYLLETRQRPRIEQISLTNSRLITTDNNGKITLFRNYGDLFCHAIQQHGILCLGIYRLSFNTYNGLSRLVTVPCTIKPKINSNDESIQMRETNRQANGQNNDKQFAKLHRRLSTCGLPVDRVLRKHSLQLNRKSLSIEDTLQQQQQHDNRTLNKNTFLDLIDQHFNKFGLNRYVISNPPNQFELYPTDVIFCLCPFESERM